MLKTLLKSTHTKDWTPEMHLSLATPEEIKTTPEKQGATFEEVVKKYKYANAFWHLINQ